MVVVPLNNPPTTREVVTKRCTQGNWIYKSEAQKREGRKCRFGYYQN